jgi:hypothetical protein
MPPFGIPCNGLPRRAVSIKTSSMSRYSFFIPTVIAVMAITSCRRSSTLTAESFYGTWIKGNFAGDTLVFFNKAGKNLVQFNNSYNANVPVYQEMEYTCRNNQLFIINYLNRFGGTPSPDFVEAVDFTWIEPGRKFSLQANQLWNFLNAYPVHFKFTKLQ